MDAVFAAIDRTESTVGQQRLYHRLRSAPVAADRDAFESLAVRMASQRALRERAQMRLARLQDPWGYELWWLAQPGSLAGAALARRVSGHHVLDHRPR